AQSQYAAAARVPLIKSPAVRVPPPVALAPDIHPLPDSVTPYFAYPFVLEPHIVTLESSRRNTLAAHAARRERLLRARDDEKEQRRREALRRVAPGFDGDVRTALEPVRGGAAAGDLDARLNPLPEENRGGGGGGGGGVDVMDDLVDQLERMAAVVETGGRTT
ncbi:hypothetical protein OG21DRAFT_1414454, partial [Imleria badia]